MPEALDAAQLTDALRLLTDAPVLAALPGHMRLALAQFLATYNLACGEQRRWGLLHQLHSFRQCPPGTTAAAAARRALDGRAN
jgi:hypothetical protein